MIPILNEGARIGALVNHLRDAGFHAVVVVDGGSHDEGPRAAREAGAYVILTERGRGRQMNAGAAQGAAPTLLFLHADTRLPIGAATAIASTLARPRCVGGCFRLRFDSPRPLLRVFGWFSRYETGLTSFGDQAFFVRRSAFEAAGGFPDWPLLEDLELRRRLLRQGRFLKASACVVTSARRFEAEGAVRRLLLNAMILALHRLGAPAHRLARFYRFTSTRL